MQNERQDWASASTPIPPASHQKFRFPPGDLPSARLGCEGVVQSSNFGLRHSANSAVARQHPSPLNIVGRQRRRLHHHTRELYGGGGGCHKTSGFTTGVDEHENERR